MQVNVLAPFAEDGFAREKDAGLVVLVAAGRKVLPRTQVIQESPQSNTLLRCTVIRNNRVAGTGCQTCPAGGHVTMAGMPKCFPHICGKPLPPHAPHWVVTDES
eukprot:1200481-Rhodomonas_salina.1